MIARTANEGRITVPSVGAVVELLKPITWFPPMWAFACGVISTGQPFSERWMYVAGGVLLAGPMVCGASQAVNDWFDRHVDAINQPERVIPSGRMPGRWGLYVAILTSVLSLAFSLLLGSWVFVAAIAGVALAWAYSAPPFRLKQNGWLGNAAVGFSYESLPWMTAAAAAIGAFPGWPIVSIALLYGIGAHGIMTLNDFKSVEGDRQMGLNSLPVMLGETNAARLACLVMVAPQAVVIALLASWEKPLFALAVTALLAVQCLCMIRFLRDPGRFAIWYSAIGVGLYVSGMMISAFALRGLNAAGHLAGG